MNTTAVHANILVTRRAPAVRALPHSSKLLFVIFSIVSILIMVNLFVSNSLSTKGKLVTDFKVKSEELKKENIALKSEIARLGSLTEIEKKAAELGFAKNSSGKIFVKDPTFAFSR